MQRYYFFSYFYPVRIYLIGYMAAGKSNLGKALAGSLGLDFTDTDDMFEERYRVSVSDFFDKYDEEAFRRIERALLIETTRFEDQVISTGGGTPCFFDNMDIILNAGFSVYLRWEVPALIGRLKTVRRKRPLLKDIPHPDLEITVKDHLASRETIYNRANLVVNGETITADELSVLIRREMK